MKRRCLECASAATCFGILLFASAQANADASLLRVSESAGPYRISVFSEPTPLRVGSGDLTILVSDRETGRPLREVEVQVQLASRRDPAQHYTRSAQRRPEGLRFSTAIAGPSETHVCPMHPEVEASRPGLCPQCGMALVHGHAAPLASGVWSVQIDVRGERGEGTLGFDVDVEEPEAFWVSLAPSLAVPPVGIALFILHQVLQRRMQTRRGRSFHRPRGPLTP